MAVKYERIVEEDLNLGVGTVDVTMPAGGTAIGHRIGPQTFTALAFIAAADGSQVVTGGLAAEVVELPTSELDVVDWFDDATTYEFAPTVAGRYHIDAYLAMAAFTGTVVVGIYKNDTLIVANEMVRSAATGQLTLSALVDLDGDADVVTLRVSHNDGANPRTVTAARMSGFIVGRSPAE